MTERKIESSFRSRRLTSEEDARDNEVRRKVEQEFPQGALPRSTNDFWTDAGEDINSGDDGEAV